MSEKTYTCLWLYQPWALLAALGEKQYETRHWNVKYRGPLVIGASKRWTHEERYFMTQPYYAQALARHGYNESNIPLGCALALVDLKAIYRTEDMRHDISAQERAFGNFADGRFAWRFENVRMFAEPIPMSGKQGLFQAKLDLEEVVSL